MSRTVVNVQYAYDISTPMAISTLKRLIYDNNIIIIRTYVILINGEHKKPFNRTTDSCAYINTNYWRIRFKYFAVSL